MATLNGFDATQVAPATERTAIPDGKYQAAIVASAEKATKSGTGRYLELTFQVLEGEHHRRKLWARLNLQNPNSLAVSIAQAELSAICHAVGVMKPQDSAQLHDLPLTIDVKCRKRGDTQEIVNEITGYHKRSTTTLSSSKPAADNSAPWMRT